MGIVVKKRTGSTKTTISEVTSADASIGKEKSKSELDREATSWVKLKDNQGYDYYWNTFTDNTTYDKPDRFQEGDVAKGKLSKKVRTKDGSVWRVFTDPNGAGDYYEYESTGHTQWEKPEDIVEDFIAEDEMSNVKKLESMTEEERKSVVDR